MLLLSPSTSSNIIHCYLSQWLCCVCLFFPHLSLSAWRYTSQHCTNETLFDSAHTFTASSDFISWLTMTVVFYTVCNHYRWLLYNVCYLHRSLLFASGVGVSYPLFPINLDLAVQTDTLQLIHLIADSPNRLFPQYMNALNMLHKCIRYIRWEYSHCVCPQRL